ncbi:MAG: hypothetical protein U0797_22975 [Gemmataceae bacterium]
MTTRTAMLPTSKVSLMAATPAPAPLASPARAVTLWLAPLASAALLYLSFFPADFGWLAWVALIPWLCLVRLPGRTRGLCILPTFLQGRWRSTCRSSSGRASPTRACTSPGRLWPCCVRST